MVMANLKTGRGLAEVAAFLQCEGGLQGKSSRTSAATGPAVSPVPAGGGGRAGKKCRLWAYSPASAIPTSGAANAAHDGFNGVPRAASSASTCSSRRLIRGAAIRVRVARQT